MINLSAFADSRTIRRVRSFRAWKLNAEYLKTQLKDPEERQNAATAGSSAQSAQKRPEADFNPFSSVSPSPATWAPQLV